MIDWGQALTVGGIGFLTVFVVLSILALALSLVGWLMNWTLNKKTAQKAGKE
jgi:Na+-transporting methylmalonyl-CoA/oxaloacetate decarboxylase gamma subunit